MFITLSFKKSLIVEQFQGNYLKQPRISEFYTLTKIHKKAQVGRPIVSGSSGPTERISSFVDSLLQSIAIESYLKDTTDFI